MLGPGLCVNVKAFFRNNMSRCVCHVGNPKNENKPCLSLSMLLAHLKTVSNQPTKSWMATKIILKDWKKWKKS